MVTGGRDRTATYLFQRRSQTPHSPHDVKGDGRPPALKPSGTVSARSHGRWGPRPPAEPRRACACSDQCRREKRCRVTARTRSGRPHHVHPVPSHGLQPLPTAQRPPCWGGASPRGEALGSPASRQQCHRSPGPVQWCRTSGLHRDLRSKRCVARESSPYRDKFPNPGTDSPVPAATSRSTEHSRPGARTVGRRHPPGDQARGRAQVL